jgi:hypothetical protein
MEMSNSGTYFASFTFNWMNMQSDSNLESDEKTWKISYQQDVPRKFF